MKLLVFIVNEGIANRIIKDGEAYGILGNIIIKAEGSSNKKILKLLGLENVAREILFSFIKDEHEMFFLQEINHKYQFYKKGHGVVFTVQLDKFITNNQITYNEIEKTTVQESENVIMKTNFDAIISIVDCGMGEEVIDIAKSKGATGGTIVHARGSSAKEAIHLFNIDIDEEKEIVLIIVNSELTENIINAISEELKMDTPANGIIYSHKLDKAIGLYQD